MEGMKRKPEEKLVVVHKATNEMEAFIVKGLLESHDIPCILTSHAAHSVHMFTVDGMGETRLLVKESQAEEARAILANRGKETLDTEDDSA